MVKTYTFGLLAAALIITPTSAFAQQSAGANQTMNQSTVIDGSGNSVSQSGIQYTNQSQTQLGNNPYCNLSSQIAYSNQVLNQGALVVGYGNKVDQSATQATIQNQIELAKSRCH